ncbi:hypothetical protein BX600DRAFT_510571 [Xylariales sp. PMI_506]|nr:hypothetical protein BX600DRAFT_510571 [Xylariales sp. PMI_506]
MAHPGFYNAPPPPVRPRPAVLTGIRANGPASEVISECPETKPLTNGAFWYILPEHPDFLICTRCYATHIEQQASLAPYFARFRQSPGVPSVCRFWTPRMVDALWPVAVRTGRLEAVKRYAASRPAIRDCTGAEGVAASAQARWFSPCDVQPPSFLACEACYEDRVLGTPFALRFGPCPLQQRSSETWVCDLCLPFVGKAVKAFAPRNDWQSFLSSALYRSQQAPCGGASKPGSSHRWRRPRQPIKDLVVCETCFLDEIALSPFEHEFVECDSSFLSTYQNWTCDFSKTAIKGAFMGAKSKKDFGMFHRAAQIIMYAAPCSSKLAPARQWYTLAGPPANFDICESCYVGIFEPSDLAPFLAVAARNPSEPRFCDLNNEGPNWLPLMLKLGEAVDFGDFSVFGDYARRICNCPPCPRMGAVQNAAWFGFPDCTVCTQCFETYARDTRLASQMTLHGTTDPRPTTCDLYTPRMRQRWEAAGATGDVNGLLDFARARKRVYEETSRAIDNMGRLKLARARQAMNNAQNSIAYSAMDGQAVLGGTTGSYIYQGGSGNWYDTWQGMQGESLRNQASAGLANLNSGDEWSKIARLAALWKEVE